MATLKELEDRLDWLDQKESELKLSLDCLQRKRREVLKQLEAIAQEAEASFREP